MLESESAKESEGKQGGGQKAFDREIQEGLTELLTLE